MGRKVWLLPLGKFRRPVTGLDTLSKIRNVYLESWICLQQSGQMIQRPRVCGVGLCGGDEKFGRFGQIAETLVGQTQIFISIRTCVIDFHRPLEVGGRRRVLAGLMRRINRNLKVRSAEDPASVRATIQALTSGAGE